MPASEGGRVSLAARTDRAVTVVIPTHNRRHLLPRTLNSVLQQHGVDVEVIVVDDGSSDGTAEAVTALDVSNVRLVRHEQSKGVAAARNAGLELARTPWIAFVDDDDIWAPDKLRAQLAEITANPSAAWSCVGAVHLDPELNVLFYDPPADSGDVSSLLMCGNGVPGGGSGVLTSTDLARQVGAFDEAMSILADWDFYLRLSLRSSVAAVTRPLLGYYIHLDSMYHDPRGIISEFKYLEEKYAPWPDVRLRIDYPTWYLRFVRMETRKGNGRAARALLRESFGESGPGLGPILGGMARWAHQKVTDRNKSVPREHSCEVSSWVQRYRGCQSLW